MRQLTGVASDGCTEYYDHTMDQVTCPHCRKQFELSDALKHRFEEEAQASVQTSHKKAMEEARMKAEKSTTEKLTEKFSDQLKRLQEDAAGKEEQNRDLIKQLSSLTDELRKTRREKDEAELTMKKKLAQEEEKIREEAGKKAQEAGRLKLQEKEKQLESALKEAEDLRRKLSQGSQQMQGEAFELAFESLLQTQYPHDKIVPVGKGVKGGDIVQEVWDARGNYAGKILWELKNTKVFGPSWVDKLKADKRTINAEEAVLISEVLPGTMKTAGYYEGLWVTGREFVIPLADTLRAKLIQMYYVRNSVKAKDTKMEVLYTYLSGTEFRHRVEAIVEAFTAMQTEIEREKRYFQNKWARDEKNIRQVIDNTYGMHGDFKGIVGAALPQIKGIDMLGDGE